jgi:RNA polymerase sigma factor (TIGR02999 family)
MGKSAYAEISMYKRESKRVTELLLAWGNGDKEALDELIPLVHDELYHLAARQMQKQKHWHTLQTTALVNEAYCKLVNLKQIPWQNRAQFFAIAARMMRQILIDHARTRVRAKRGGAVLKFSFDDATYLPESKALELVALDDALTRLAKLDPFKSRIVEMKFFAGLNFEEIAEVEQVSSRTIEREWRKAKVWLYDSLQQ